MTHKRKAFIFKKLHKFGYEVNEDAKMVFIEASAFGKILPLTKKYFKELHAIGYGVQSVIK